MLEPESSESSQAGKKKRVFLSYDIEHDGDLHDRLVEQASRASSGFEISARSAAQPPTNHWDEELRRMIREADEVIAICGEHTNDSSRMGTELLIAQEESRPYLLLWGRRETMCTKPSTAKPADTMFSWTWEILQSQMVILRRAAESSERAAQRSQAKVDASSA